MNNKRLLHGVLLGCSFLLLTGGLAFAEHDCTRQVVRSDGTVDITTDCSSESSQSSENFTNRYLFSTLINNLKNNVNWGMQDLQAKYSALYSSQDKAKQFACDTQEKEQEARDDEQTKLQSQETQLQDMKDRQEALQDRISNR